MKRFVQLITAGMALLFLGTSALLAQEVTYSVGPAVIPSTAAANGGFAWGDVNGDGYLDVFIASNNILLNNGGASFSPAVSTMTAGITNQTNGVGGVLADFNGDGVVDLFTTNGGAPAAGLYYNTKGVFTLATGTGDLANAGVDGEVFQAAAAAPIDHSNYLSVAWPGNFVPAGASGPGSNNPVPAPAGGIWLLKGGASGFTDIGRGATAANAGIDTSRSFESWDVRFFDANNDGWQDLLMPSFRQGFSRIDTGSFGTARKGCVLFMNDGTGKFKPATTETGFGSVYSVDSIRFNKAGNMDSITYATVHTVPDTGIIVDDTVRHFSAIGEQVGDLNNDGIPDLILNGLNASDNRDGNDSIKADIILYGNGDGTFTYKWDGVHVVPWNGLAQATGQRAMSIGDYNNDGLPDILTSETFSPQHLYRNNGDGTFTDVASTDGLTAGGTQRSAQFVDYNKDGFLDVLVYTGGTAVLEKNGANSNNWIGFIPVGAGHNMSAVGARFTAYSGGKQQIRDISASAGSAGQGGNLWANFGFKAGIMDSMMVRWPDGTVQMWTDTALAAGGTVASVVKKYWTIVEGANVPLAPVKARPSWVAKGDTALLSKDTLKWNKATGGTAAVTYEAQVATASSFATVLKDVTSLTDSSTIVNLGLSTTYYWRVRAFAGGFTGAWSPVDSFKTLYTPCNTTPSRLYPLVNSLTETNKTIFKFSYVQSASTYHLEVDTLNKYAIRDTAGASATTKFGGLVINDSTSIYDTTYVSAVSLTQGRKYFWRVRGWNSAGSSAYSAVDSFTVMYTPATPVLAYPGHNGPNVPTSLTFKWSRVVPAGHATPGDSNYIVQFWTYTSTGTQLLTSDTTNANHASYATDSSLAVTGLQNRAKYYWKVMTFNQGGSSAFTAVDSFTTATEVPGSPSLISPKSATLVNRIAMYVWNSVTNSTSYHIQVSAAADFSAIVYDKYLVDTSVVASDTLGITTRYYWRVSAVNAGGEGGFSGSSTFTTSSILGVALATDGGIPTVYALNQNYPNPFNPSTTISYDIPKLAFVNVDIYDVLGRRVVSLVNEIQSPNHYKTIWNASNVSSGMYFLRIRAKSQDGSGEFSAVKKLMLMK
ncbi:MAG: FG-GAP-like repeat-containing protein [Bacteroidota bacterium]